MVTTEEKATWLVKAKRGEVETIYILGAGPSLKELPGTPANGIIIFLNSAMEYLPHEFPAKVRKILFCDRRYFLKNWHAIAKFIDFGGQAVLPNQSWVKCHKGVYRFKPSRQVTQNISDNQLLAGYSSLIPALHCACLLSPKNILFAGVDLTTRLHWNENASVAPPRKKHPFAAWRDILNSVSRIKNVFKDINYFVCNDKTKLAADDLNITVLTIEEQKELMGI